MGGLAARAWRRINLLAIRRMTASEELSPAREALGRTLEGNTGSQLYNTLKRDMLITQYKLAQ